MKENKLDKRTREYKELLNSQEDDCGCNGNKPKQVVLKKESRSLTEDELIEWGEFKSNQIIFTLEAINYIHTLYESVFNAIVAKPVLN